MNVVKEPHTCIFSGPTSCGKTQLALNLIEKEYRYYFENIVILCPTLQWNKTYMERLWIRKDDSIFLINPKDQLFECIDKLSQSLCYHRYQLAKQFKHFIRGCRSFSHRCIFLHETEGDAIGR